MVIDPLVIALAFLAWMPRMRMQQALSCAAWLTGAWALSFALLMTASHSWPGLFSTMFAQNTAGYEGAAPVLSQIWGYSGLIIGLAVLGAAVTLQAKNRNHAALLSGLCFVAFIVSQLHDQTPWTIDKHLAYGIWFAAIAAGYACSKFIRWLPGSSRQLAALCCVVILAYPAAIGWQSAWERYHAWADAGAFISAFKPIAARSNGLIYLPGQEANIAEYYTPQGSEWTRWGGALSLNPPAVPSWGLESYYRAQLHSEKYGVIVLFYSTTFSSVTLPDDVVLLNNASTTYQDLLSGAGSNSREPGLSALTQVLETDTHYRRVAVGSYNTSNISGSHDYGIYAIWQKAAL
jgi:hypothetical protein